jgi:hypothetical protein
MARLPVGASGFGRFAVLPGASHPWITGPATPALSCKISLEKAHYLVSQPYPFGPDFEICEWNRGTHIRILWLLPITETEKDFRRTNGLEALESLFEDRAINPVDPGRRSVI